MNIPGNWVTHLTPSGYMDRDGWFKTTRNFLALSGTSEGNPQFVFFNGHNSHWGADALNFLRTNYCHPFFLQSRNSENDQPNNNGPNECLKENYNMIKE